MIAATPDAPPPSRILVADDVAANVAILVRILRRAGYADVLSTTDPAAVVPLYVNGAPDIVLLDLHMPENEGVVILRTLRSLVSDGMYLPIVILTGDMSPATRRDVLEAGASDFITKPYDPQEVALRVRNLLETRELHAALAARNRTLEFRVRERTAALVASQVEMLERLAAAAEQRDGLTAQHTRRVGRFAAKLAELLGEPPGQVELIRLAAPLHDIGKIAIPDGILSKPARLTAEEYHVMKSHTTIGAELLSNGSSDLVRMAETIARSHHERWDGFGYPQGLAGDAIPFVARIVSVADVYDALANNRVYRAAMAPEEVMGELRRGAGTQFDARVIGALCDAGIEALWHYPEDEPVTGSPG